jgi:predicted lipid carrier protein YhbT/chorismate mutase
MRREPSRIALAGVRGLIDGADDALLALMAGRRRLVTFAAGLKQATGWPARDRERELEVRLRAQRLGRRLGLPPGSSERLISLLIEDACTQQGLGLPVDGQNAGHIDLGQCIDGTAQRMLPPTMDRNSATPPSRSWMRLLPPPARLAPMLRLLPSRWQARWLEEAMRRALVAPLAEGRLDALVGRRIGIEVGDLGLRWVVSLCNGRLRVCAAGEPAEATVRGSATDLLLLASRREDADTLFFQRRLVLIGDTELGLTARNLLDQLSWQEVPLGLRIVLHRAAGLAQSARAAHRGEAAPG